MLLITHTHTHTCFTVYFQWCSSEWEEQCSQHSDGEESETSALDTCIAALQEQEEQSVLTENPSHAEWEIVIDTVIQGSKLTFLLGSTGAPNFKKLGAPQLF